MTNQATIPLYENLLHNFETVAGEQEPAGVQQLRKEGLQQFRNVGFPTRRNEDWKYTVITPFLQEQYQVNGVEKEPKVSADLLRHAHIPSLNSYEILVVNGHLQKTTTVLPEGVGITSINEAIKDEKLQHYFGSNTNIKQFPFAALNTAMFSAGIFLEVDAKAVIDKPIHVVHVFTSHHNLLVQPRNLIVIHKSAQASVIETIISDKHACKIFINNLTEVVVEENAIFDHYNLQTAKEGTRLVNQTDISQKRDSVYSNYTFSLPSADLIRNNLNVALNDEKIESHLYGLYLGSGDQLIDNHSLVNHKMPHCDSNEIYKGVLLDNATGVFNGKIYVQLDAQKTNAFQQNNNLLLSNKATINTKPQLEILADDVKCSHGATVGQLSNEAMFYLRSRGIGEEVARALLVNAFAFDVTEKIKIPELEHHINHLISTHIPVNKN